MAHSHSFTWSDQDETGSRDPLTHWFYANELPDETDEIEPKRKGDPDILIPHVLEVHQTQPGLIDGVAGKRLQVLIRRRLRDGGLASTPPLVTEYRRVFRRHGNVAIPFFANEEQTLKIAKVAEEIEKKSKEFFPVEIRIYGYGMPIDRGELVSLAPPGRVDPAFPTAYETIVAVIDVDIAFAHNRFRDSDGKTRIAWFWDQEATKFDLPRLPGNWLNPFGLTEVPIGRELFAEQINERIGELGPATCERDLYSKYLEESYSEALPRFPPSVYAHGTHVLDVATGWTKTPDNAGHSEDMDDVGIFAVQLPRRAVSETHGIFLTAYLLAALHRVKVYADLMHEQGGKRKRPKVLVNISVGGHAGRHDGFTTLEQCFDRLIGDESVAGVFLSAGNSYNTNTHAVFRAEDLRGGGRSIKWRIQPDDGTASFMEIWLPEKTPDADSMQQIGEDRPLRLWITPPGQPAKQFDFDDLVPGTHYELMHDHVVMARLYVEDNQGVDLNTRPAIRRPRRRLVLAVRHTRPHTMATGKYAGGYKELAGDWDIRMEAAVTLPDKQIVGLWIFRDEQIVRERNGAKQSVFVPPPADQPNPITNEGTTSDMANGRLTSVVAGHVKATGDPADYSSEGIGMVNSTTLRDIFPTGSAQSEMSSAHPGMLAAGFYSGTSWRLGGTSVSSPLALREVCRYVSEHQKPNSPKSVLEHIAGQQDVGPPELKPSSSRIGRGRLNSDDSERAYPVRRRP